MPDTTRIIAGAMSGTSADGVDVAITEITDSGFAMQPRLILHHQHSYSAALRQRIFALRSDEKISLHELAEVGREISLAHAIAIKQAASQAGMRSEDLTAIAAHGQTLFHAPPTTIQWFDPALLAYQTNCAVISDFRRADCAAGGQGAPLVPFADYLLFRDAQIPRVVLNIGGIANLTYLPAGARLGDVIAFDTGPGNCLSDWLCRQYDPHGPGFDAGGKLAMAGNIHPNILQYTTADKFFAKPPPKSTDIPQMIDIFRAVIHVNPIASFPDLLRTACELTILQIQSALKHLKILASTEIIASGGGIENQCLLDGLKKLPVSQVRSTNEFGIPSPAKEAVAFALLGAACLDGEPANLPSVTGASRQVVLGSITPKP
ncbi:MAG TPA: anhydro-N-acetylmuramic acid kinase [Tepidisphaeraceae bacterium]|jgi:anhydro-N-acetylmuramic acid kinase